MTGEVKIFPFFIFLTTETEISPLRWSSMLEMASILAKSSFSMAKGFSILIIIQTNTTLHIYCQSEQKTIPMDQPQKDIADELQAVQEEIYALETVYLQNTREKGNILIGFSSYGNQKYRDQKYKQIDVTERLFSLSSVTSKANLTLKCRHTPRSRLAISHSDLSEEKQQQEQEFSEKKQQESFNIDEVNENEEELSDEQQFKATWRKKKIINKRTNGSGKH